jgi:hypothetical protein
VIPANPKDPNFSKDGYTVNSGEKVIPNKNDPNDKFDPKDPMLAPASGRPRAYKKNARGKLYRPDLGQNGDEISDVDTGKRGQYKGIPKKYGNLFTPDIGGVEHVPDSSEDSPGGRGNYKGNKKMGGKLAQAN